jgi:hypothetical protein
MSSGAPGWTTAHEYLKDAFATQRGKAAGAIVETRRFLEAGGGDVNAPDRVGCCAAAAAAALRVCCPHRLCRRLRRLAMFPRSNSCHFPDGTFAVDRAVGEFVRAGGDANLS